MTEDDIEELSDRVTTIVFWVEEMERAVHEGRRADAVTASFKKTDSLNELLDWAREH